MEKTEDSPLSVGHSENFGGVILTQLLWKGKILGGVTRKKNETAVNMYYQSAITGKRYKQDMGSLDEAIEWILQTENQAKS